MRQVIVNSPSVDNSKLGALECINRSVPDLKEHEILVKVEASAICHRDIIDRLGGFRGVTQYPLVPGHEVAGSIVMVGSSVRRFQLHDRVVNLHTSQCGSCKNCEQGHGPRCTNNRYWYGVFNAGGYANYMVCAEDSLVAVPKAIRALETVCFANCTAGVALRALRHARMQSGESVLVTGASGGVGLMAIQVAKRLGASRVVALTSRPEHRQLLIDLGADEVLIDESRSGKWYKSISTPVDCALELVGTPCLNGCIRSMAPLGRIVIIGNVTVEQAKISPGLFILKEISVTGSSGASASDLRTVLAWIAEGKIKPIVSQTIPLDHQKIDMIHRQLRQGTLPPGRVVIIPNLSKL